MRRLTLLRSVRCAFLPIFQAVLMLTGCAGRPTAKPPAPAAPGASSHTPAATPATLLEGKVVLVNQADRFVVVSFPIGHMPALGQRLDLYRNGLKRGEVKITGPQWDENAVADISAGDAQTGDLVREQ